MFGHIQNALQKKTQEGHLKLRGRHCKLPRSSLQIIKDVEGREQKLRVSGLLLNHTALQQQASPEALEHCRRLENGCSHLRGPTNLRKRPTRETAPVSKVPAGSFRKKWLPELRSNPEPRRHLARGKRQKEG